MTDFDPFFEKDNGRFKKTTPLKVSVKALQSEAVAIPAKGQVAEKELIALHQKNDDHKTPNLSNTGTDRDSDLKKIIAIYEDYQNPNSGNADQQSKKNTSTELHHHSR